MVNSSLCREITLEMLKICSCFVLVAVLLSPGRVESIVYLRKTNERGPTAWQAGLKCLQRLANVYFYNLESAQAANLEVFIAKNMSSPAQEIVGQYLEHMHHIVFSNQEDEQAFQIRVVSNSGSMSRLLNLPLARVTLADYYVVVSDTYDIFDSAMKHLKMASAFNPNAKFIILFNNPEIRLNAEVLVLRILRRMFIYYESVNVLLAFATGMSTYEIYVSDPYSGAHDCGQMKARKVGACENGALRNPHLTETLIRTPKVSSSMDACTFKLCARISNPFVNANCNDGLEMVIIDTLKDILHFKFNKSCSVTERGEITEDGEWSHLLGKIRRDECDVIIGAFFPDFEVHAEFGVTNLYFEDYYTWYVPKAELEDHWKALFLIFKINTWRVFAIVLVVSAVFWFICGHFSQEHNAHKHFSLCFLNTWALFLCVSSNNRPEYISLRIFFVILALYGLSVTAIYSSKLVSVFTNPPLAYQMNSVDELLESGLPIGGRLEYEDWFINENEQDAQVLSQYNTSDEFQPLGRNLYAIVKKKRAILMSRIFVKSHPHGDFVFGFTQDVFSNQLEMITERGFPLLPKFNKVINYMTDMGLIAKVYNDFRYNITIIKYMKDMLELNDADEEDLVESSDEIVLTTEHMQGAFTIYIFGMIVSFVVFLGELAVNSVQTRRAVRKVKAPAPQKRKTLPMMKASYNRLKPHNKQN